MGDLWAARQQMALSLGWHIVIACFGVGFPALVVAAEAVGRRRDDADLLALARRWSNTLAVLFAVGAVSGTILSFEFGILWPGLMGTFGDVWGLPFVIEAIAFFVEAIFVGLYLYGWERLTPKVHVLTGVPIVVAGVASAWFVVTANAWMNQPRGFDVAHYLSTGEVIGVDPWAALFNPATPPQTTHMILAAFMVAGFATAAVYATAMLRGRTDRYHRLGFLLPFAMAAAVTPFQIGVGDWAARFLADRQPVKFAALEGLAETERGAPLTIGGVYVDGRVRYGVEIPRALSLLAHHDPDAEVIGLASVPPGERPPVAVVRMAFQTMVAIGTGLLALGAWFAVTWRRRRRLPESRWFLRCAVVAGPLAVVALEAGWVTTEVGRQPWIVYRVMRVGDAVTTAPGIRFGYYALVVVYTALTVGTVYVLRRLARSGR
ncbi:MAG: cytochrome bd ubiquinol oxidase subunit [Actinomycetota bacterium]|jgi:cytochrome d ubiquinol oxidase subunit I|nr:cytochrome bd ubiquinol oxidase subunit [Actinomycetota bacterium]